MTAINATLMENNNQLKKKKKPSLKNAKSQKPQVSEQTRMKMVQHERQALHFKLQLLNSLKGTMLLR